MILRKPRVLLTAHWDWVLYQFRLPLARALREQGYDVALVCPPGRYVERIEQAGFRWIRWDVQRRSMNPVSESHVVWRLRQIYRTEAPTIVHHFTIKPNLYGTIAARSLGRDGPPVINTFMGLGFLYSDAARARVMAMLVNPILRSVSHRPGVWTVFQNKENLETLCSKGLVPRVRAILIEGSGVDIEAFHPDGSVQGSQRRVPRVLFAGRLLLDKGLAEFVSAARRLIGDGIPAEFWVAGEPDEGNLQCVPQKLLQEWRRVDGIRWLGHVDTMVELLREVDIAVLPSYHEGVPRFLLEAAACGLPIVATDIEGCREVVRHGENGFLVSVRDANALAEAIATLVRDRRLRQRMGTAGRDRVVRRFDEQKILQRWLQLYEQLLKNDDNG